MNNSRSINNLINAAKRKNPSLNLEKWKSEFNSKYKQLKNAETVFLKSARNALLQVTKNNRPNNSSRVNTQKRFFPRPSNVYRRGRNTVYGASYRLQNATDAARRYIPKSSTVLKGATKATGLIGKGLLNTALLAASRYY